MIQIIKVQNQLCRNLFIGMATQINKHLDSLLNQTLDLFTNIRLCQINIPLTIDLAYLDLASLMQISFHRHDTLNKYPPEHRSLDLLTSIRLYQINCLITNNPAYLGFASVRRNLHFHIRSLLSRSVSDAVTQKYLMALLPGPDCRNLQRLNRFRSNSSCRSVAGVVIKRFFSSSLTAGRNKLECLSLASFFRLE